MKTLFTFLLIGCLSGSAWATIFTVCPNTSYPAQFATIQAANDSASPGDTIYVYPAKYLVATNLSKRLVLIGPGLDPHRPTRVPATMIQPFHLVGAACSGTVIMGITFNHEVLSGNYTTLVNNLSFIECRFNSTAQFWGNNILVENCILYRCAQCDAVSLAFFTDNAYGNIIQNNYIQGSIALQSGTNTLIRNNIFASVDVNSNAFLDMTWQLSYGPAVHIFNNIFYKSNPATPYNATNESAFINNIYYLTSKPIPSNLLSSGNINADPQFVNFPAAGDLFSFNYDYHLQSSSPGIKYGTDGYDVGIWDGPSPVNAGFEPPIPRIYDMKVGNSRVPAGGTIQLTIKASKAL